MKKLSIDDLQVETFVTTDDGRQQRGTVHARTGEMCPNSELICPITEGLTDCYETCYVSHCGSCPDQDTCDYTCGGNYGCDTVDVRCTHGGVYIC